MFKDRLKNYKWLEHDRQSRLLVYITGDRLGMDTQISTDILDYFSEHLDKINKAKKISLLLYTRGGDTMAAWSLVNLIHQYCDAFEVIIPSKCLSSGTIISLGADNIMMTKQATLGPIDPSVNGLLNPQNPRNPTNPMDRVPVSVESIQGFIELAKKEFKLNGKAELKEILLNLSDKVHPLVLGNVYRSRSQIQMVAKKLLTKHLGDNQEEKIKKIVSFLCSDSGSHDYAIYRDEAKNELELTVQKPNDEQYSVISSIFKDIREELKLLDPFSYDKEIGAESTASYSCRRVLIESIEAGTDVLLTEGTLTRINQQIQQPNMQPIQRDAIENVTDFYGWKHESNE